MAINQVSSIKIFLNPCFFKKIWNLKKIYIFSLLSLPTDSQILKKKYLQAKLQTVLPVI